MTHPSSFHPCALPEPLHQHLMFGAGHLRMQRSPLMEKTQASLFSSPACLNTKRKQHNYFAKDIKQNSHIRFPTTRDIFEIREKEDARAHAANYRTGL